MHINSINFRGMPPNYSIIDKNVSRSAQPLKDDFIWLKDNGVTDIINFRTLYLPEIDFDERNWVTELGMNYHNIKSFSHRPKLANVLNFLEIIKQVKESGGKAHIHCKAGADRTGMYAFIYKTLNNQGTMAENIKEWIDKGHNTKIYPHLIEDAKKILNEICAK